LLSADPEMAAAYGRTAHFCGAAGLDLMEPLTFKGREGSGQAGGRCAYADATLTPKYDWQKFEYYYRVWGRKLYDPEADPETWRRWLRSDFGSGTLAVEAAVANASRILPLLTSAHLASASNHSYWPEIYTNMPIVIGNATSPYSDTPDPKCFATVSPLDPETFATIAEYVGDLLAGNPNPKYSPVEVAQWMEDLVAASNDALAEARQRVATPASPEFRRMEADVLIQVGLGSFFATKLRSGVLYEIFLQTGATGACALALVLYQRARQAWATMASRATAVYRSDIAYGSVAMRRGHWSDRLAAIDKDIVALAGTLEGAKAKSGQASTPSGASERNAPMAIQAAIGRPSRGPLRCDHTPPSAFHPGEPLALSLQVPHPDVLTSVLLHYRHVDQGERWQQAETQPGQGSFAAAVPAEYTQSAYELQYYFELRVKGGVAWLYPGFNPTLSSQPYYAVARGNA
jgi:hypothetical protein